jgi:transcriptional regulator GlxA family with amidase domain
MPTRIGLLLYPGCMPAGLLAAADLFQVANLRTRKDLFAVEWVALRRGAVTCAHGQRMTAEGDLATSDCDVLLVPGFWAESAEQVRAALLENRPVAEGLRALGKRVSVWSYCTGVALVAQSGRLKGQGATATWWMAPWLQKNHAAVDWQWQHACVINARTATASGMHGYFDLVCEHVERKVGAEAWRDIARLAVLPKPPPAASVFESLGLLNVGDPLLARLRSAVEELPASQATIDRLAAALATSPRTLARKVQLAAGRPVGTHVRLVKLSQAGERLIHTRQSVGQICLALGFADEASFRRMFKQVTGRTPADYRLAYRLRTSEAAPGPG